MGHSVTIGGERLGAGKRSKAYLHNYERSTHDLGYVWRSTMAPGTLVPFMTEVALPGDTFDIDLNANVLTHPTVGPLFGSYKLQLDVFQVPIRLYQAQLHMNQIGIGLKMSEILLPVVEINAGGYDPTLDVDNQHMNPSCIFSYLNIRGLGFSNINTQPVTRQFNAIPYLGYWDIYKNYYANKQEEIGVVIHKELPSPVVTLTSASAINTFDGATTVLPLVETPAGVWTLFGLSYELHVAGNFNENSNGDQLLLDVSTDGTIDTRVQKTATEIFNTIEVNVNTGMMICSNPGAPVAGAYVHIVQYNSQKDTIDFNTQPSLTTFPLKNLDDIRTYILQYPAGTPFEINLSSLAPFGLPLTSYVEPSNGKTYYPKQYSQEGLAIKTYNSDLLNNWISTEWIDGPDGISTITAVDTSSGSFTIDELNMSKKVYNMLNRIAISGGSYDDWLDAVYTHDRQRSAESPMYMGGLIRNIVFNEVVSTAQTRDTLTGQSAQPLGTLAGRGTMGNHHKGGTVVIKVDEPSYIMGIVSITPNIDYSQGNKWDVNLKTMDDFHKPALDEIGFQDLITEQMAWFGTEMTSAINATYKSAGKQPAWINYMTNINQVRGNFADKAQQMFMVLNRRYEPVVSGTTIMSIKDVTTYIDPVKFNHIFADTRRDAQNFWVQIGVDITARRKMSAKIMPNL